MEVSDRSTLTNLIQLLARVATSVNLQSHSNIIQFTNLLSIHSLINGLCFWGTIQ